MAEQQNDTSSDMPDHKPLSTTSRELVKELVALSGRDALNRILDQEDPHGLVQHMSHVDFFWLIKKIGEDDSFPLLKMSSPDQWQYLLDMELWQRDRLNLNQTSVWLARLQKSDPKRLIRWLFSRGESLAYYYFFKKIEVEIKNEDEESEIPDGFFTLDNVYYIRILDREHEDVIDGILRKMAQEDYTRYQAILLGLVGVMPAEIEEDMYRMRNVRLAEDGFLPFEEAVSVYSYLKADSLKVNQSSFKSHFTHEKDSGALFPISPLIHVQDNNLLAKSMKRITDTVFLDRIRLEFAGLCSQILSADRSTVEDLDVLINTCRKASSYINLGLEGLSGENIILSEQFLKDNPLISIFRVGFGLALELKWEAERWAETAWVFRQALKPDFWGGLWGGTLKGIIQKRPRFFSGFQEGEEYKEFEHISQVENCRNILHRLIVLDRLIEILTSRYALDKDIIKDSLFTFHPLLFNFWARIQLKLDQGFSVLSLEEARGFFQLLRAGSRKLPYLMTDFKEIFIKDILIYASDWKRGDTRLLNETLSLLWEEFVEEYAWVATDDLDGRFSRFILIQETMSGGSGQR